ncbi:MAG: carbon storage regulator [Acidimicrobiaceae bacterium]|nr:carbon storage regulator [Acidimicrobiaceae bacterium]
MLVLTHKEDEQITIGKDIVITIVEVGHGQVRIGIEAPKDLGIGRPAASD